MQISLIPPDVLNAVRQALSTSYDSITPGVDDQIAFLSTKEVFELYCQWHGLIGWADALWENCQALQDKPQLKEYVTIYYKLPEGNHILAHMRHGVDAIKYCQSAREELGDTVFIDLSQMPKNYGTDKVMRSYTEQP
jgi:hypothetical protein